MKFIKRMKIHIHEGFNWATLVDTLRQVFFAKNMDNLQVEIVGASSNKISTYIYIQYLIPTNSELAIFFPVRH